MLQELMNEYKNLIRIEEPQDQSTFRNISRALYAIIALSFLMPVFTNEESYKKNAQHVFILSCILMLMLDLSKEHFTNKNPHQADYNRIFKSIQQANTLAEKTQCMRDLKNELKKLHTQATPILFEALFKRAFQQLTTSDTMMKIGINLHAYLLPLTENMNVHFIQQSYICDTQVAEMFVQQYKQLASKVIAKIPLVNMEMDAFLGTFVTIVEQDWAAKESPSFARRY